MNISGGEKSLDDIESHEYFKRLALDAFMHCTVPFHCCWVSQEWLMPLMSNKLCVLVRELRSRQTHHKEPWY